MDHHAKNSKEKRNDSTKKDSETEEVGFSFNRTDMDKWLVKYNLLLDFVGKWASKFPIKRDHPLLGLGNW